MLSTLQAVQLSWRVSLLRAIVDRQNLCSPRIDFVQTSLLLLFCGQSESKNLAEISLVHTRQVKYISLLILRLSSSFPLLNNKPIRTPLLVPICREPGVCKIVSSVMLKNWEGSDQDA